MSYAESGKRQGPPRTGDNTLGGGRTQIGVGVEWSLLVEVHRIARG
jgi:hypothetical protein